jgi:pimeloyl-ACP methyl ester carboxylesterase
VESNGRETFIACHASSSHLTFARIHPSTSYLSALIVFDVRNPSSDERFPQDHKVMAKAGKRFAVALLLAASSANAHVSHRVQIEGQGRATVIFESGLGDTLESWGAVQSAVAAGCARTLTYNRAGYAGSDPPRSVRDAQSIVAELRSELRTRGLKPPYVLVGHSLGGLYMQYFARQYAEDVAGLVLVDSTHWNQQLLMGAPRPNADGRRGQVILFMDFITRQELAASALAGDQVHSSPLARSIPTIVLSSTGVFRGETPAARVEAARLQENIVSDFPGARHIRVEGSGHYIQKDRPDTVTLAVREISGCKPAPDSFKQSLTP